MIEVNREVLMSDAFWSGGLMGAIVGLVVMVADRAFEASDQFVGLSMLGGIGIGAATLAFMMLLLAAGADESTDRDRAKPDPEAP